MFCSKCGSQIPKNIKYCPYCGNCTLSANQSHNKKKKDKTNRDNNIPGGLVCFIFILSLILIGVIGWLIKCKTEDIESQAVQFISESGMYYSVPEEFDEDENGAVYASRELLIFSDDIQSALKKIDAEIVGEIPAVNLYQVRFPNISEDELDEMLENFSENKHIQSVYKNYAMQLENQELPSDSGYGKEWKKNINGDTTWNLRAIHADDFWNEYENLPKVNIGVLDSAFYLGKKSDVQFADTFGTSEQSELVHDMSHGLHVSGIIGADWDNDGIAGIVKNCNLYGFAYTGGENIYEKLHPEYNGYVSSMMYAIGVTYLVVDKDCKVINISSAFTHEIAMGIANENANALSLCKEYNEPITQTLAALLSNGYDFVICKAAGNTKGKKFIVADAHDKDAPWGYILKNKEPENVRRYQKYLANEDEKTVYGNGNPYHDIITATDNQDIMNRIIVVGAVSREENDSICTASYSCDQDHKPEIYAPGTHIYSCDYLPIDPEDAECKVGKYKCYYEDGTSMAAPHVTAAAALALALSNGELTGPEIKQVVINSYTKTGEEDIPLLDLTKLNSNVNLILNDRAEDESKEIAELEKEEILGQTDELEKKKAIKEKELDINVNEINWTEVAHFLNGFYMLNDYDKDNPDWENIFTYFISINVPSEKRMYRDNMDNENFLSIKQEDVDKVTEQYFGIQMPRKDIGNVKYLNGIYSIGWADWCYYPEPYVVVTDLKSLANGQYQASIVRFDVWDEYQTDNGEIFYQDLNDTDKYFAYSRLDIENDPFCEFLGEETAVFSITESGFKLKKLKKSAIDTVELAKFLTDFGNLEEYDEKNPNWEELFHHFILNHVAITSDNVYYEDGYETYLLSQEDANAISKQYLGLEIPQKNYKNVEYSDGVYVITEEESEYNNRICPYIIVNDIQPLENNKYRASITKFDVYIGFYDENDDYTDTYVKNSDGYYFFTKDDVNKSEYSQNPIEGSVEFTTSEDGFVLKSLEYY